MSVQPTGLLLSDDLIFTSRITATAQAHRLPLKPARAQALLLALAGQEPPACVIVDLDNPGLEVAELLQRLRAAPAAPFVVAYGSHVDTAALRAARQAGCDLVLPRSKFVEELPLQLPAWFAGRSPEPTANNTPSHHDDLKKS
jgi:DNA-binding NarL/FixJ family response regulator